MAGLNQNWQVHGSRSWNGMIDEWASWDKSLSEEQRNAVFNDGKMADLKALGAIHWWRMGENVEAGGKIKDEIGDAHLWAGSNPTSGNTNMAGFQETPGWGC